MSSRKSAYFGTICPRRQHTRALKVEVSAERAGRTTIASQVINGKRVQVQRRNPAPLVIACSGGDSHHLKLTMTYDRKNVDFGEVDAGPGKSMASIIYPNDPKRRLEVWWSDVDKRKDLYLIAINGSSTWTGPGGLRLGLSLADLEKLNRKPFKLKGFDKDNTAPVSDWDHGALAALSGGCKAGVILSAEAKTAPKVLAALPADSEFSSADEALRAVRPSVTEILIGY